MNDEPGERSPVADLWRKRTQDVAKAVMRYRERGGRVTKLETELLEALKTIQRRLNESAGGGRTPQSRASLRKVAGDAIAKAEGEQ